MVEKISPVSSYDISKHYLMDAKTEKFIIKFRLQIFALIAICITLSAWTVLNGDILFHTDIARDFLVLEDIVKTHKPTLLGPRSGGISGVFHGPLWFYINLPIFILGKGNPVDVGWFHDSSVQ